MGIIVLLKDSDTYINVVSMCVRACVCVLCVRACICSYACMFKARIQETRV